jgi:protein TonB
MEPAAGPSDANELPETAASGVRAGAVDQARVSGVSVGAAVTGGTGGRGDGAATIDVITPARARAEILPVYPRSARKAGLEGFVRIAAVIDESGIVVSAEVLASSGNSVLDQAALQEVRRAIFEPARLAGKPVPFRLIIPFRFRLN